MSGRWWRAYSRARHDPKLLRVSDKHFRWWFNLLCVAADNGGLLPSHADLAVEFRVSAKSMTDILDALVEARLLDHDDGGIRPHNWSTLQYQSDVSNERVKRYRERRSNGACNVTSAVTVTSSETETESDTEQNLSVSKIPTVAERAPREPVSRAQLLTENWEPTEIEIGALRKELPWLVGELYEARMRDFRDWCVANATMTFNPAATWRAFMRKTKPQNGATAETFNERRIRLAREALRS